MANGNAGSDVPDGKDELPPGLAAWFAIEECVGETLDALEARDDETYQAIEFITRIHRAVRAWLSWELWAALLAPGLHTPDSLLESVLKNGVDVHQLPRSSPATPPQPGQAGEWHAFEESDSRG